jgi:ubiquinone/menaquinone biosynthesis C-methylase UbiE
MEPFDKIAAEYQRVHGENPYQRAAIAELARRLLRGASVLDLGCGTGVPTARVMADQGHRVRGVDTSSKMLDLARKQVPEAMFTKQDMRDAAFPPDEFDAVVAYFSLMMLSRPDISFILGRARTWLKPDGLLSVSFVEFDADSVDVKFMGARYAASGYSVEGLERLLAHHEFSVLQMRLVQYQPQLGPSESQIFCLAQRADQKS